VFPAYGLNLGGNSVKLGILGGMGPLATADFFKKIIEMTDATPDQEHLRILVDDNPQIPDRTTFIMGNGADPTKALLLATKGTYSAGIYDCPLSSRNIELIRDQSGDEEIPVILGCTELPLIVDKLNLEGMYVDTTAVLAKTCIELGKKQNSN